MSLEARVGVLEEKFEQLDKAFKDQNKIIEATHGVVCLILKEQEKRFNRLELEQERDRRDMAADRRENARRFDKIEDTLVQIIDRLDR